MGHSENDAVWMKQAYDLAKTAQDLSEVPVGAVLVGPHGEKLGEGHNQVIRKNSPMAHAEVLAIEAAAQKTANHRLPGTTLYVTLEPCAMCAGLIVHARIKRLVFACRDFKSGAAGSVCNLLKGPPWNHAVIIDEGIMSEACAELLQGFFRERR